jgi:hypothetical protein
LDGIEGGAKQLTETQFSALYRDLVQIVCRGASDSGGLRGWGTFVRTLDGACNIRGGFDGPAAYHMCRKSFTPMARFQTENGVTLCKRCYAEAHKDLNGKPDFELPMDVRGGEKKEGMAELFRELAEREATNELRQ